MKARIVSDLHVDVNRDGNFGFRHLDQDILFIAGDIAGSYERELKFLQGLSKDITCPIYVVAGNHLGYDYHTNDYYDYYTGDYFGSFHGKKANPLQGTKQWSIDYLKKNMPENITYLDNDYVDIGDYIVFGGTMYSDYKLYPDQELNQRVGEQYLNDFRYVHIKDKDVIRPVNTDDYIKYHAKFMRKLKKCIKETDKDIIVLAHFAPSIKSIESKYLKGIVQLNASYASNMEQFILDNPRIKYFIHGHVHSSFDYSIGQCQVLCCPFGYHINGEQRLSAKKWNGMEIDL